MAKALFEIKGFNELQQKLKKLGNDKDKRRIVLAILRKSARSTIVAAKALSPKRTRVGEKSIKFTVMRRAKNPMGVVGPSSVGKYDGWYLRQFVIPGHNIYKTGFKRKHKAGANEKGVKSKVAPNYFMDKAKSLTQGRVADVAVPSMEKFIQRKIDQL